MMAHSVVIADDHPIFRRGLREVVERDGAFRVVGEAGDGQQALALIRAERPELVLLDISMPELDGLDVLAQLHGWPDPPAAILLTMHDGYLERALELGALGYLLKENAEEEVLACLHDAARGLPHVGAGVPRRAAPAPDGPLALLTATERRILKLLAGLKTSREIGALLSISHRTVQNHCANMTTKLGLRGAKALLRFGLDHLAEL